MTNDTTGFECQICHQETFRVLHRKAYVEVTCCHACANRIDLEEEQKTESEMMKVMSRAERRVVFQERSREWARKWNGKHVKVTYQVNERIEGEPALSNHHYHIKGTAYYGSKHEDVGYGRVKVVLDEEELPRVVIKNEPTTILPHQMVARIDGYRWGIASELISHQYYGEPRIYDNPLAFYINWGERFTFVLEEVDDQAELLVARREQERLEQEHQRETEKHFGEGI